VASVMPGVLAIPVNVDPVPPIVSVASGQPFRNLTDY